MQKRITQTKAARIREYMLLNPDTNNKALSDMFKVDIQVLYNIRYHLKKRIGNEALNKVTSKLEAAPVPTPFALPMPPVSVISVAPVADMVNSPPHYTSGGIETIDYIQAKLTPEEFNGYLKGNILKYGSRLGLKGNDMQDAGKLGWYANRLRETIGNK